MTSTKTRLPRILPLSMAKRNFGKILDIVHEGKKRFIVHSRGYAEIVVIMSVGEYFSEFAEARGQLKRLSNESKPASFMNWTERDINREIRAYRRSRKR